MNADPLTQQNSNGAMPPKVAGRPSRFAGMLRRTSDAFTAEYVVCLVALGITLSNLAWLVYTFFGLIIDTMHGGTAMSYISANMFVLWLAISSLVAAPTAVVLWSRVQGELAANATFKGELPKGAARGFRTFWMIAGMLGILGMVMAAVYAPLAALVAGSGAPEVLLAVTLPSLINAAIIATGLYIVTRRVDQNRKARLLMWIAVGLTAVLFTVNFIWASNMKTQEPTYPTYEYPRTVPNYDPNCIYCGSGTTY